MPSGAERHSSVGGQGWVPRTRSHLQEVAAGQVWARCGCGSEAGRLRAVLLAWPPDSVEDVARPGDSLMVARPRLDRMRAEMAAVITYYRSHDIEVHVAGVPSTAPPNVVFMRDLFLMTRAGAIVGRAASAQRAGEERHAAAALAGAGIPIVATTTGDATFEGADALWLAPDCVLLGTGFRTNGAGERLVRAVLRDQGVSVVSAALPAGVQHLLGAVCIAGDDVAAVHAAVTTPAIRGVLAERGYRLVEMPPDRALLQGRGMNFVAMAPSHVVMPAGCAPIRHRLRDAGVDVDELPVDEFVAAAGGLACMTGILHRE